MVVWATTGLQVLPSFDAVAKSRNAGPACIDSKHDVLRGRSTRRLDLFSRRSPGYKALLTRTESVSPVIDIISKCRNIQ